ncbi:hypothetical protein PENTCL1PPCAC_4658, partial [Pristionchus entomophagus]
YMDEYKASGDEDANSTSAPQGAILSFIAANAAAVGLQITGEIISGGYTVIAGFEIANFTKEKISMDKVDVIHGCIATTPLDIAPAEDMKFSARKENLSFHGTEGAVCFTIADRVLFLYWQVPLTDLGGSNEIAIAFGKKGQKKDDIYKYGSQIRQFHQFKNHWAAWDWHVYDDKMRFVQIHDETFAVRGMMDTSRKPTIKIDVVPMDKSQFADKLQKYV